jgi:hypothetical protein
MHAKLDLMGETYFSGAMVRELHLDERVLASYSGQFRAPNSMPFMACLWRRAP